MKQITIRQSILPFALIPLFFALLLPHPLFARPIAQTNGDAFAQLGANAQTVALAINQMRAQSGLPPLALNGLINAAAQNHVNDILAHHNYGHYGSDGSNVRQRVQRTGYAASTWVSENWVSVSDPSMAIQWWMNSYVHRNNILNHNWHELGIGAGYQPGNGQYIFVAVFTAGESNDSVTVMPPEPEPLPIPEGGLQYQIQPGDTLLSIGLRYGVEWPTIAAANRLSEFSVLQIGQVIRVPGVDNVGGYIDEIQAAVANSNSSSSSTTAAQETTGDSFVRRYTVQPGDTLARVALIYEISWQELARENGLGEASVLSIGQEIRIPGSVAKSVAETAEPVDNKLTTEIIASAIETPAFYTVQAGDTIITIALHYDLDWQELLRLNQLGDGSVLSLGQTIRLR